MFRESATATSTGGSQLTQGSDESWAPASSLNRRGHMTSDTHIDRHTHNDSFRSAASACSSTTDEKQGYHHQQGANVAGAAAGVRSGSSNSNPHPPHAAHLPTLQEMSPLHGSAMEKVADDAVLPPSSHGDASRSWSGKQLPLSQSRNNSRTLLLQHNNSQQRLQPPQLMNYRGPGEFVVNSRGVVLPPPPPMDDAYPSGSAERRATGAQSKSSTLSSGSTTHSSPKKVLDLGQLTRLNGANDAPHPPPPAPLAANPHLWQPQLLARRNLDYSLKDYTSNNSSDLDDHVDAESLASTYV